MPEIINLSKSVKSVRSKNGQVIEIPIYCRKRISFFRYNQESESLEIVCCKCQEAFPVLKLSEGEGNSLHWRDIHEEIKYHFMSDKSGYAAECMCCKNKLIQEQIKTNKPIPKVEEKVSYTVFLSSENKRYLQLYKIVYQEEITEVINRAIDELRYKKPIIVKTKD